MNTISSSSHSAGYSTDSRTNTSPTTTKGDQSFQAVKSGSKQNLHPNDKIIKQNEQAFKKIELALEAAQGPVTTLEMSVHEQSREVVIKVKNKETGEVIREVPAEKILDMVSKFMEMNGLLLDEKA